MSVKATSTKKKIRDGLRPQGKGSWECTYYKVDPQTGVKRRFYKPIKAPNRTEARKIRTDLINDKEFVVPNTVTMAEWFPLWLERAKTRSKKPLKALAVKSYSDVFERYVRPRIGSVQVQDLNAATLGKLYDDLLSTGGRKGKGISSNTCRHVHIVIHLMLSSAVKAEIVSRNVADAVDKPAQNSAFLSNVWTPEQVEAFVARTAGDRLGAMWRLAALYGPRRGEVLAASWDAVNLDNGTWDIKRSLLVIGRERVFDTPKSDRSRRKIQLDAETVAALKAHRKAQLEERAAVGLGRPDASGLLFTTLDGKPLDPNAITKPVFPDLVKGIGLPRCRLHDLRHAAISRMVYLGIPINTVSEIAGHASVAFTLQRYGHVMPRMRADAANLIGGMSGA